MMKLCSLVYNFHGLAKREALLDFDFCFVEMITWGTLLMGILDMQTVPNIYIDKLSSFSFSFFFFWGGGGGGEGEGGEGEGVFLISSYLCSFQYFD